MGQATKYTYDENKPADPDGVQDAPGKDIYDRVKELGGTVVAGSDIPESTPTEAVTPETTTDLAVDA